MLQLSTGRTQITLRDGLNAENVDAVASVLGRDGRGATVTHTAANVFYVNTTDGGAQEDNMFTVLFKLTGADYKPQQAFIAGQVALTEARTDGVPYRLNYKVDGQWAWAVSYKLISNISSTTPLLTIDTGLTILNGTKPGADTWYITMNSYPLQGANYTLVTYVPSTGVVKVEANGETMYAGQIITLEYLP